MAIQAKDIMHTDLDCVRTHMSVGQLAKFLQERSIRGAPVLDAKGRLVGVVSVSDSVFRSNSIGEDSVILESDFQLSFDADADQDWSEFDAGDLNDTPIEEIMSTLVVSAEPDASQSRTGRTDARPAHPPRGHRRRRRTGRSRHHLRYPQSDQRGQGFPTSSGAALSLRVVFQGHLRIFNTCAY